jgi:hypothetical protein
MPMEAAPRDSKQGVQLVGVLLQNVRYVELGEVAIALISQRTLPGFRMIERGMCLLFDEVRPNGLVHRPKP